MTPNGAELSQHLRSGSRLKHILTLATGSASGQAIIVLFSPALTRLYDVDAFGVFGIFGGIVTSIASIASLKFEQAILLETGDDGADRALRLCVTTAGIVAGLSFCGFVLLSFLATDPTYRRCAPILVEFGAINIFILGCMNGLRIWFTRAGNFRALGGFQFSRSACVVAFQLLFSLVGRKALFLVGGQVIGLFVATAQLVAFADRSLFRALVARYQPASMWAMARRYSTFALYGAPQTFGRLMSQNIPALMLPVLFGPAQSGLFWLAYRMLILPGAIFVESTRSVFFLQASEVMKNGGDLRPVLIRPAVYLGLASAVVSLLLWAAGPAIFGLAFGAQWRESGHYAAIISIAWAFENISVSSSVIISLLELQKVYLTLEVISLALRAAALYAGYLLGSAEGAVGLYSGVSAIMVVAVIIYVQWILSRPERRIRDAA